MKLLSKVSCLFLIQILLMSHTVYGLAPQSLVAPGANQQELLNQMKSQQEKSALSFHDVLTRTRTFKGEEIEFIRINGEIKARVNGKVMDVVSVKQEDMLKRVAQINQSKAKAMISVHPQENVVVVSEGLKGGMMSVSSSGRRRNWWGQKKDEHYYLQRGEDAERKGDVQTALRKYHKAVELGINFEPALLKRAQVFEQLGYWAEAREDYVELLRFNPGHREAQSYLNRVEEKLTQGSTESRGTRFNQGDQNEAMKWAKELADGAAVNNEAQVLNALQHLEDVNVRDVRDPALVLKELTRAVGADGTERLYSGLKKEIAVLMRHYVHAVYLKTREDEITPYSQTIRGEILDQLNHALKNVDEDRRPENGLRFELEWSVRRLKTDAGGSTIRF